ncbi:MAG: hypothetical protein JWN87_2716, partial [Frankiales bacterium]|nr:hypothetical protein [Frankiales bacterium]
LGRPCTRWLSAQPLDGARFAPPSAADRTESCVDAAGRLLTDRWFVGGRLVRTRTAVSVGTGPRLVGGGLFDGGEPTPLPTGGSGFVIRRSTTAELSRLLGVAAPAGPAGMRADLATAVLTRGASGFAREGAVLTWTDGTHLAVLRLERDLERAAAPALRGEQVALGHLGSGRLEPVLAGLRVTAAGPRGLRLTATADLPEAALLGWLRSVRL